jgi:hypothetical protein
MIFRRWLLLALSALPALAFAHDVGLSTGEVRLQAERVNLTLTFAVKDVETLIELDSNRDGRVAAVEFTNAVQAVDGQFAEQCSLWCDGNRLAPRVVRSLLDATNNVIVDLEFTPPQFRELEIRFDVIRALTAGHRMFVTLRGPRNEILAERLLNQEESALTVVIDSATMAAREDAPRSFAGFLRLGVEHIGTGYDHLLFLLALLIVAPSFRAALLIITSFTVAHTLTLAVATLGWFTLRPSVTEPLIALTIVYVGGENLWRHGAPTGRWRLTFAFGLVHGFGFASVLRDLGIGAQGEGVAMPLLAFNLGVELGQLALAALALPVIWKLRQQAWFPRRVVPAVSAIVTLTGAGWFIQRVWF